MIFQQNENYGDSHHSVESTPSPNPTKTVLRTVLTDKKILTIGLASCFFEGSMYLFVFFWTPALKATQKPNAPSLPLGMIFACFMGSVMLGSLMFNLLVSKYQFISHARFLTVVFATASSSLLVTVVVPSEVLTFWSFCIFEACVGIYFPCAGYLKGRIIEDGIRARVYGMLRIPLNIFVVVALSLVKEGPEYRNLVFITCSGLLVVTSAIFHHIVNE